jgi:predicted O-methyltransferase YrrM
MAADRFVPHNELEYAQLLKWARGSRSILEIGSRYGYTLVNLAHVMEGKGRIVSIDFPGAGPWGNSDSEAYLRDNVNLLRSEGYNAHLYICDSRDQMVVNGIRFLAPFDFVFIDGDHTYEGVKADWENYGPLGKCVAFHDIVQPKPGERQELGVWRLWAEIRKDHVTQEFIAPGSKMGIGLVGPRLPTA